MLRKIIVSSMIIIFMLGPFLYFRFNAKVYRNFMRSLNEDIVYLNDGAAVAGWIWDDKAGVVVGEGRDGDIFVFSKQDYGEIQENRILDYLRRWIL